MASRPSVRPPCRGRSRSSCAAALTAAALALWAPARPSPSAAGPPAVFLLDAARLERAKQGITADDPAWMPAWRALRADADAALSLERLSVVDKAVTAPSGDRHDYTSQAPYFWRNPGTSSGLPYVRRDGERNPEINAITDHAALDRLEGAVETLSLAWYFSGDDRYARHAADLLRAWFVDPATRMNPNLEYAQFVPGLNPGRGIGLIETRNLTRVVDAIGLLRESGAWPVADDRAVKEWFSAFLEWMQTSANGRAEASAKNNHGTYYDLQVASYALFLGRTALARGVLESVRTRRIALQIEADGREPLELARTRAWSYSVMNLDGLTRLAQLGDRLDVDLWHYDTTDGRSLRSALMFLAPYAFAPRERWAYQQLGQWAPQALYPVLRRASPHYANDPEIRALIARVPPLPATARARLTGN